MDADKEERYADFPVFKGLLKPLVFKMESLEHPPLSVFIKEF